MSKVEFDVDAYLLAIAQAQQLDDLPVIRVELKRPIITLRFIILFPLTVYWVLSIVYALITEYTLIIDFSRQLLVLVISFVLIGLLIDDYYKLNLKLLNPKKQEIYYCELTPKYFKWVFNEQVKEILWHEMMFIEKFVTGQYDYARIEISPTYSKLRKDDIILYNAHLPCYYRDLYEVIVQYREKRREFVVSSI